jgi:predicted nucleic-acid-binding protein
MSSRTWPRCAGDSESDRALEVALELYRNGTADFADCLHIVLAAQAGMQPLWTFDKGAAKVSGEQLLTP